MLEKSVDMGGTPLRIGLLGEAPSRVRMGGLNRYFEDLAAALRQTPGVEVSGVSFEAADWAQSAGCLRAPLILRLIRYWRESQRLNVDVVDAHFALYALLPLYVGKLRRTPVVFHFQGPWADESAYAGASPGVVAAKRLIERLVYRKAAAVVVLSRGFGDLVSERYGVPSERVNVIPPAVDLSRFTPDGAIAKTESVVVARRLEARMGFDLLLDAWKLVTTVRPRAALRIVGTGTRQTHLNERVSSEGIKNVSFLGPVSDAELVDEYRRAQLSVVPTEALEGFGLVVLESLASGTPCLATRVGGLVDALESLDESMLVSQDPADLSDRIVSALAGDCPSPAACREYAEGFSSLALAAAHVLCYERVRKQRPHVVYLDHTAELSGGELALARILPWLEARKTVILAEDGPLVSLLAEQPDVKVSVVPLDRRVSQLSRADMSGMARVNTLVHSALYTVRIARILRRLKPDIIHTNSLKSALYGGLAGRIVGVPVIWHIRDRIADDYMPRSIANAVRAIARVVPTAVIVNSQATGMTVFGHVVAHSAVAWDSVEPFKRADLRSEVERIGILGRISPWKGQDVFLRAFALAFPPPSRVEACIVGNAQFNDGPLDADLKDLSVQLGLGSRVDFRGFRVDVGAELRRLDVLVHASTLPEPFGQVIIEGLAAGVPVIASAAGGPLEIIKDGVEGLLFPPGDIRALADRMQLLASDVSLRRRLADSGVLRAADFAPERVVKPVNDLYNQLASHRRN
jgi:glycosyltransferase involved in cell wall biosynthesis